MTLPQTQVWGLGQRQSPSRANQGPSLDVRLRQLRAAVRLSPELSQKISSCFLEN